MLGYSPYYASVILNTRRACAARVCVCVRLVCPSTGNAGGNSAHVVIRSRAHTSVYNTRIHGPHKTTAGDKCTVTTLL